MHLKVVHQQYGAIVVHNMHHDRNDVGQVKVIRLFSAFRQWFGSSYHWPVIGYESDIKAWTKEDLENYFKMYYAPNNCTVVVVGDVKADDVLTLAKEYFEPIPRNTPPPAVRTIEPPQEGEKRLTVYKEVSSPNINIVYH